MIPSALHITQRYALVQNIRRGHYNLATDVPVRHRLRVAFYQLTAAI